MVLLLLLLVTAASVSGWSQQTSSSSNEVLTLDQAIGLALLESHVVKGAELETGKTGDALAATRTSRLPSMEAFSLAGEQFVKPTQVPNPLSTIFPGVGPFFSVGIQRRPTNIF